MGLRGDPPHTLINIHLIHVLVKGYHILKANKQCEFVALHAFLVIIFTSLGTENSTCFTI